MTAAPFALPLAFAGVARAEDPSRFVPDATFPPFEYSEGGVRGGFDVELIDAIANILGRKVEWTEIDFKGLVPGLVANRFDVAPSAIYIIDERKKVVDFIKSYYPGGPVIVTAK